MKNLTKDYIVKVIKEHESEIKSKFKIKKISLFGSYAQNKQKPNSDIDILVEFDKSVKNDINNELEFQVYLYNLFEKDIGLCQTDEIKKGFKTHINSSVIQIC